MSVKVAADANGPFAKWSGDSRKYRFKSQSAISKAKAIQKAKDRGAEIKLKDKKKTRKDLES